MIFSAEKYNYNLRITERRLSQAERGKWCEFAFFAPFVLGAL